MARSRQTKETPGNQPSSPLFGPEQLEEEALKKSTSYGSALNSSSTTGGKVRYSSDKPKKSQPDDLSDTTSPEKVVFNHDDAEASFYVPANSSQTKKGRLKFSVFGLSRRQKWFGGGGGLGALIAIFIFLTLSSGPLELIHIAQLLTQFHFSSLQDQSDDRFTQEARFIRYKSTGRVYKTNLGIFQNYIADNLETRLKAVGIEPMYNNSIFGSNRDGWFLDPDKLPASDYEDFRGKTPEEIKDFFNTNFKGINAENGTYNGVDGIVVSEEGANSSLFGYRPTAKLSRLFLKSAGMSKITSAEGGRILTKRAGSNWSPLSRARDNAFGKAADFLTSWWESMHKGRTGTLEDEGSVANEDPKAVAAANDAVAEEENPTAPAEGVPAGEEAPVSEKGIGLKAKLSIGGAAVIGVACTLRDIDSNAKHLRQVEVVYPLIREATTIISIGYQLMSGQNLTEDQVSYINNFLSGPSTQSKTPDAQTSWYDAQSIQAELGQPNVGVPASSTLTGLNQNTPFHFLNTGVTGDALYVPCSEAAQVVGAISNPEFTAVTYIIGQFSFVKHLYDDAAQWASGEPLNVLDRGADAGNDWNFGALLASNAQAVSEGGRMLSSNDSTQLALYEANQSQQDFQAHNVAYRIFNPYDERSAISKLIDQQSPQPGQEAHNIALSLFNFGSVLSSFSKIFTTTANAAPASYSYGIPEYGFSVGEMNSSLVKNPYKNADDVVNTILPNHPEYIQRAQDCFGVTIAPGTDPSPYNITSFGTTAVDPGSDAAIKMNTYQQPGTDGFNSDCADTGSDWMQVRFYIFDSQTMASTTCYLGNDADATTQQACADIGQSPDNSSATTTTAQTPTTTATSLTCASTGDKNQPAWAQSCSTDNPVVATDTYCDKALGQKAASQFKCPADLGSTRPGKTPHDGVMLVNYTANGNRTRQAMIYVPKTDADKFATDSQKSASLPLVIFLHGRASGSAADSATSTGNLTMGTESLNGYWPYIQNEPSGTYDRLNNLDDAANKYGAVVIDPEGQGRVLGDPSWGYSGQISDISKLPAMIAKAFPWINIDSQRVYVMGASMGGDESLGVVTASPGTIAAAYSDDGVSDFVARYGQLQSYDASLVPSLQGEVGGTPTTNRAAYVARSAIDAIPPTKANADALNRPILLDVDKADTEVPNSQSTDFYNAVKAANPSAPIYENCWPGLPHSGSLGGYDGIGFSRGMDFFYNGGSWIKLGSGQATDVSKMAAPLRATKPSSC